MAALDRVLAQHEPFPAVVMDRRWDIVRVNDGAARLFGGCARRTRCPTRPTCCA